jgi:transposase
LFRPTARQLAPKTGTLHSRKRAGVEAIGRSSGGRTTKCHGVCDEHGRLRRFRLTAGQRYDLVAAWEPVDEALLETHALIADKGYDSQELRAWLDDQEMVPVIPRRGTDRQRPGEHADLYSERNRIERAFNRLGH